MKQVFYISTGRKNVMYTLRFFREVPAHAAFPVQVDFYVCTLAATADKAEEKARAYVEAYRDRVGESEDFKIVFVDGADGETFKRRGKLSAADTRKIEMIEDGVFPFGKHANTRIEDAPQNYVLFFADKAKEDGQDLVMQALCAACAGVALDKGYIALRDAKREERAAQDALSEYVGAVGKRQDFDGEILMHTTSEGFYGTTHIYKVRCGKDLITYMGSAQLGERGACIRFSATVKKHELYNGVKNTYVQRPTVHTV